MGDGLGSPRMIGRIGGVLVHRHRPLRRPVSVTSRPSGSRSVRRRRCGAGERSNDHDAQLRQPTYTQRASREIGGRLPEPAERRCEASRSMVSGIKPFGYSLDLLRRMGGLASCVSIGVAPGKIYRARQQYAPGASSAPGAYVQLSQHRRFPVLTTGHITRARQARGEAAAAEAAARLGQGPAAAAAARHPRRRREMRQGPEWRPRPSDGSVYEKALFGKRRASATPSLGCLTA
jgi:hypothetical protein